MCLHSLTLLNLLFHSSSIFCRIHRFSTCNTMLFTNKDFTCIIPMPVNSLSCFSAIHRTSKTMLNKSGRREHPCLFFNLRGKAFIFTTKYAASCKFLQLSLIKSKKVSAIPNSLIDFLLWIDFIKCFFLYLMQWSCSFAHSFINMVY